MDQFVSAVVCTHNRSRDAVECVESILSSHATEPPPVVLVDSASEDEHAEVLRAFAREHDTVVLERCERPGLSFARNRAAAVTSATWLLFIDDDARPCLGWWQRATNVAVAAADDVVVVGGRILPSWPGSRPEHVGRRWLMFLSCIEEREQEPRAGLPECYGANLMVRRSALLEAGGFPLELGRVGGVLLSGEENHLQHLLVQRGGKVLYDGDLVVEHRIEPVRLTVPWIVERAFWGGVSEAVAGRARGIRSMTLNPLRAAAAYLVLSALRRRGDPQYDLLIRAQYARGILFGRLRGAWLQRVGIAGDHLGRALTCTRTASTRR